MTSHQFGPYILKFNISLTEDANYKIYLTEQDSGYTNS